MSEYAYSTIVRYLSSVETIGILQIYILQILGKRQSSSIASCLKLNLLSEYTVLFPFSQKGKHGIFNSHTLEKRGVWTMISP